RLPGLIVFAAADAERSTSKKRSQTMQKRLLVPVVTAVLCCMLGVIAPARAADQYTVDPMHTSVYFKISHLGLAHVFGRFNEFSGSFTIDPEDPSRCSF